MPGISCSPDTDCTYSEAVAKPSRKLPTPTEKEGLIQQAKGRAWMRLSAALETADEEPEVL